MIRAYVEQLGSIGPHRMARLWGDGLVSDFYVRLGEDDAAGVANRNHWSEYANSGWLWGWYVCGPDQAADVAQISALDAELHPTGWCLNIEKPLEGADLSTLVQGVKALGRPMVASLAGLSASHVPYDYRTLDRASVEVEWQAYFDSGEGPDPTTAAEELYSSTFVVPGWEYRSWTRFDGAKALYGWGKVTGVEHAQGLYDSYRRKGPKDCIFATSPREWGYTVATRNLWRDGRAVGYLLGRARYSRIRVALEVTRTAQSRPAADWKLIAGSARIPRARKRPVSVYMLDNASDEVVAAMAAGSA